MPAASTASSRLNTESSTAFKSIVQSIMMEAAEKCEEIDVECEEEYQVLRKKEISEQAELIEKADAKRRDIIMREDSVCYTKLINNSRLALLKAKNDIQNDIILETKRRISKDTSSKYQKLMEKLLTQAMFMLMEPDVNVTCRKDDQHMISSVFQSAAHTYEKKTKLHVNVGFSQRILSEKNSSGGMLVSNNKGNITVNCLVDARVEQVCSLAAPVIVQKLFSGVQITRESPKLSYLKAITPDGHARSLSPQSAELKQERSGIGSSSINLLHHDSRGTKETSPEGQKPISRSRSKRSSHREDDEDGGQSSKNPDTPDERHSSNNPK